MDDTGGGVSNARMRKARANFDATPGQRALKGRVANKRNRLKEEVSGARRHNEALGELNRRRNVQQIQKRPPRVAKGAAGGVRTKNVHMQEFQNTKSRFQKRTMDIKAGTTGGKGGLGNSRRFQSRTAPTGNTLGRDSKGFLKPPQQVTSLAAPTYQGGGPVDMAREELPTRKSPSSVA